MSGPGYNCWLHRLALLTALATLALLAIGGLVTSHGVGLAVPDWPNTFGYNMFLFRPSKWLGGILYEHTHRLTASLVGLLTTILAAWLWVRETRSGPRWLGASLFLLVLALMGARNLPVYVGLAGLAPVVVAISLYQARRHPQTLRWWGVIAFAAVILQGVLGGLRVVLLNDQLGIFHAILAQLFFVLVCALAFFTSKWWRGKGAPDPQPATFTPRPAPRLRVLLFGTTLLILGQLILGATMRHQHAGLAIPDFPLAYGKLWPAIDPGSVALYNQRRFEVTDSNPITAFQIGLQMAHRIFAVLILAAVALCAWSARRRFGREHLPSKLTLGWLGLIVAQVLLGAWTVWSNKAADVATAHVLVGALSLATGAILSIVSSLTLVLAEGAAAQPRLAASLTQTALGPRASAVAGL